MAQVNPAQATRTQWRLALVVAVPVPVLGLLRTRQAAQQTACIPARVQWWVLTEPPSAAALVERLEALRPVTAIPHLPLRLFAAVLVVAVGPTSLAWPEWLAAMGCVAVAVAAGLHPTTDSTPALAAMVVTDMWW